MSSKRLEIGVDCDKGSIYVKELGSLSPRFFDVVTAITPDYIGLSESSSNQQIRVLSSLLFPVQSDFITFYNELCSELAACKRDIDPEFEYVGITTTVYCRLSDNKKVIIRTCKLEDGTIEITDTDSGAVLNDAILGSDYDAECPQKEYECTEVDYNLEEGQSVTYEDLLLHFENNSTFDDGSKGAEGISYIMFGNSLSMDFFYNGVNTNNFAGTKYYGKSTKYDNISQDIEIVSNKGLTTITYVVYKCI